MNKEQLRRWKDNGLRHRQEQLSNISTDKAVIVNSLRLQENKTKFTIKKSSTLLIGSAERTRTKISSTVSPLKGQVSPGSSSCEVPHKVQM